MTRDLLLGFGLAAVLEGLALALAPGRIEQALDLARALGPERLRLIGLAATAFGVGLVALARG